MQICRKFGLEKYHGLESRHQCPQCGDARSFVLYVDEEGEMLASNVGRCNHESSCGYHYTPRQYFADHSSSKNPYSGVLHKRPKRESNRLTTSKIEFIPKEHVVRSYGTSSHFVRFLYSLYPQSEVEQVCRSYCLGETTRGEVIYWQIDVDGNVRTGKIMQYNEKDGHRVKSKNGIGWIHNRLKRLGRLSDDFRLCQCLFGEHLLSQCPDATVALVEAEKSAIICSIEFPDYIWLAVGSKSQLKPEKLFALKGRNVILFPDVDGYETWKKDAEQIKFCNISVSDYLERVASPEQRASKIDIADLIIEQRLRGSE